MKATALILFCAIALTLAEEEEVEVELNEIGCPYDPEVIWNVAHDTYCNLFYTCNAGALSIEQICPQNLVFNSEEQICDWTDKVDCGDKGIYEKEEDEDEEEEEKTNPGGNSDPSLAAEICAEEDAAGTLVAHENCDQYYQCDSTGIAVALECNPGLLYNYDSGICDWPWNVECGDRVMPTYAQLKRAALKHQ